MKYETGDLLAHVQAGLILQQVNCQGAMGSGFAKAVLEKWPAVKTEFVKMSCPPYESGANLLGRIQIVQVTSKIAVVNLFTQEFYGRDGKRYTSYDALDTALSTLRTVMDNSEYTSADVHHPAIGAGLGGGHWPVIAEIIEHRLGADTTLWLLP